MTRCRCFSLSLAIVAVLALPQAATSKGPTKPVDSAALSVPTDAKLRRKLQAIEDYIQSEEWATAARNVQVLLDLPEDQFVSLTRKGPDGKAVETLVGVRSAADRLVAGLPRNKPGAGLEVYETIFGPPARALLRRADTDKDRQELAEVTARFLYTAAGGEAAHRLAVLLLDDGDPAAARAFERLIERDGLEKLEPLTLYNAARAFQRSHDRENRDKVWKQLQSRAPKGLRIDGKNRTLKELEEELQKPAKSPLLDLKNWPVFGGTPSRDGQGTGGPPFLEAQWRHPLFGTTTPEGAQLSHDGNQVQQWIETDPNSVIKRLEAKGEAVIPAAVPVTATFAGSDGKPKSVVMYRTYDGVFTRELNTGKREWQMSSAWSLERMHQDPARSQAVSTWVTGFKDNAGKPGVIIENATVGTMSSAGGRVYFIDDLQVPPSLFQRPDPWGRFPPPEAGRFPAQVDPGVQGNTLRCTALDSGKLKWSLPATRAEDDEFLPRNDFRHTHFLGAPLPLGGKLYFLNEKSQEIRLVCLDLGRVPQKAQDKDVDDAILWVQPLGTAKEKMLVDYGRRIHGTHIAYGDGILVCPTNAGVIVGVDLLTHGLLWAHTYAEAPAPGPAAPPRFRPFPAAAPIHDDWKSSAPIVQDGKVVFALPDSPDLRCLSLRDGRLLWRMNHFPDDLYLAGVFAGRVVVVSKKEVRALALDDGKELWRLPTGMPSGRGIASDNVYYLPLREAVAGKGPEVASIDLIKGRFVAHIRPRPDRRAGTVDVPGNLIFADGLLISQSATELVAYPLLESKLKEMGDLLKKDPRDPVGLLARGELRLDQGKLVDAVEDFRTALANKPERMLRAKLRGRLHAALTDLLRQDFGAGEKYLKEYEELSREPVDPDTQPDPRGEQEAEVRGRRFTLLTTKGRGYESQGKAVDALNAYLELAGLKDDGILATTVEPALRVRPDVWARGRIAALYAAAKPPSRRLLDDEIEKKWKALSSGKDSDALRAFVTLFSPAFAAGRQAQLKLAERLMEGRQEGQVEAEQLLIDLSRQKQETQKAGQALEALARFMSRQGRLEDALHYYRILARDYGATVIRDGKKGAAYLDDLSTDKRFLPLLMTEPAPQATRFKATEDTEHQFAMAPQHMLSTLTPEREVLPSLRAWRVAVNYSSNHLKLVDRRTGEEKLSEPLKENFQVLMSIPYEGYLQNPPVNRFGYHAVGHLVVANLGQFIVGIDTVTRRVLWDRNLLGAYAPGGAQLQVDQNDGSLRLIFQDGTFMSVGRLGPVGPDHVVLLTRDGMTALDPLTGRTLWQRSDLPVWSALFGDGERVYVVVRGADGKATATRAFNGRDGTEVKVPDFAGVYENRIRINNDGTLLVADKMESGAITLRIYDVPSGTDLWSQKFEKGSIVLHSQEPDLGGVITPLGRVMIVSLRERKLVLAMVVDRDHLKNLKEAHLLADAQSIYIAFHTTNSNNPQDPWSNLQTSTGLRAITVNGEVYAFDRSRGKIRWHNEVEHQQLVLEQFQEMPVLVFTARFNPNNNGLRGFPGNQVGTIGIQVFSKVTGRLEYAQPTARTAQFNMQSGPIYAVNYDIRDGRVELIAEKYKIIVSPAP